MLKIKIPSSIDEAVNKKALSARFSNSGEMVCRNNSTLLRPLMVFKAFKNTKVNVLVLTPPAVEPDDPPTNIRSIISSKVGSPTAPKSIVLKPAVRAVTEEKNA